MTSRSRSTAPRPAIDCKWGARGISADVLHQLDDARQHAADDDERLAVVLVVFDAARSCAVRLDRQTAPHERDPDRGARGPGRPRRARSRGGDRPDGAAVAQPLVHEARYRVRFDEAGPDGLLRTSGLMRYAQDVAWQHSTALGFGRDWYARARPDLARPVRGARGARADPDGRRRRRPDRRSSASAASGPGAAASSDRGRDARRLGPHGLGDDRRARRPDADPGDLRRDVPDPGGERPDRAGAAAADAGRRDARRTFAVRPHELDPMDHVNNAVYLDWLEEAVLAAGGGRGARTPDRRAAATLPPRVRGGGRRRRRR